MLTQAGVPWDVVMGLSRAELLGYCVAVGETKGGKFSWGRLEWEKPKS